MVRAGRDLDDHLVPTPCNLQVFFLEAGVSRDRRVKKAAPVSSVPGGICLGISQAWSLEKCLNLILEDIIHLAGSMAKSLATVVT